MNRASLSLAVLALLLALCGCGGQVGVGNAGDPAPQLSTTPDTSLKLLVIGGTSGIGLETAKLALERGHRVTALARWPERMMLRDEYLDTVAGDTRGYGGFFYNRVLTPLGLKTIYADKDRQEALIHEAGDRDDSDWTVVRPGFLTDEPARMRYRVVSDVSGLTCGEITRADVGHFIIGAIESNRYLNQTPLLSE